MSVNGESLGIYTNVESIKPDFLARTFGDGSGELFEGTVADFFPDTLEKFEPKNRSTKIESLRAFADALSSPLDEERMKRVATELDVDAFLRFWALESLTGLWDGYANNQNNYFVYRSPATSKLYFMPWGTDSAFTNSMPIPPYRIKTRAVHSQAIVPHRLYGLEVIQERYRATLEGLMATVWNEEQLNAEIDRVQELIGGHLHKSQRGFDRAVRTVRSFIKSRRKVMQRDLRKWPVTLSKGPRRPFYFQVLGEASATFATEWHERSPRKPLENGKATLEMMLEGESVTFTALGVSAERSKFPTPDGSPLPPAIVFTGIRKSTGKKLTMGLGPDLEQFKVTGPEGVVVQGMMWEGAFSFDPRAFRMVSGTVHFAKASTEDGAEVRGRLELKIYRMAGHQVAK